MNTAQKTALACGVAVALLASLSYLGVCCALRYTKEDSRKTLKDSALAVREAVAKAPDSVLPLFETMKTERAWRAYWGNGNLVPRLRKEPKVPLDHLAALVEDVFIKFAGNGFPDAAAQERIKKLIVFAESIEPGLSPVDARTLRERLLDAHFVSNDFDGAVAILEKGLPGHSENWCKAAIAKIRAHQAEEQKNDAEALKQFIAFGEAMAAEPDNGMPEYDPSTGVAYCRAWVLAKNFRRCAEYAKKTGKEAESAEFLAKAKEFYGKALAYTTESEDAKSLEVLNKEIEEAGL